MSKINEVIGKNFGLKNIIKRINGVPVEIKSYVDVETFKGIVLTISRCCFEDGEYKAENREIANRFAILKYMTDIEVSEDDINEIFKMTQGGNWFSEISREVTKLAVWGDIDLAVDRQIDYMISTRPTTFDKLVSDLSAILNSDINTNLADVKEVLDRIENVDKKQFVETAVDNAVKKAKRKASTDANP